MRAFHVCSGLWKLVCAARAVYFNPMLKIALASALLFLPVTALAEEVVPVSPAQINLSFAPVVKKVAPSVVNIYTKRMVVQSAHPFAGDPFFSQFFGQRNPAFQQQRLENSLGSGVIVEPDGLVVTNAHVVKNSAETKVMLSDGREFDARVALIDEASDIALLRIDTAGEKLPVATLESSEALEVGDLVIAIGNPFGVGQTVTSGIVSALARSSLSISDFNFFIQTDAAINPGNSGGPLVSMDGVVIGINSAIYSRDGGSLGIGFAIPSEMVATIIAAEKAGQVTGKHGIKRPWVGISAQDVTPDIAASLGIARPAGALVAALHEASPMRDAGLVPGDMITAINGKTIRNAAELRFRLATVSLGQEAEIGYVHKGQNKTGKMKTILPPDSPARETTLIKGKTPLAGFTVANLNPAVSHELGIREDKGVVIMESARGVQIGAVVRKGDLIESVNGVPVASVAALKKALEAGTRTWQFGLIQNGQKRQLTVR